MQPKNECVKVAVRCRPMAQSETDSNYACIVQIIPQRGQIIVQNVKNNGEKERLFSFDMVFAPGTPQDDVFKQSALPIIESVLEGYNGTIFAYGQTGTGKTHTMEGSRTDPYHRGIIPRTFQHIIKSIEGTPDVNFMVQISMLELYNEEICDLLSNDPHSKLQLHEHKQNGVYVNGLTSHGVTKVEEMEAKLKEGSKNRHVGSTNMNKQSSRSHSIFLIRVEQIDGAQKIKAGRLNLVDLAGSERQSKTQATGSRSKEGIFINLSLSTLGQVIGALTNPNLEHIPYRNSKLTRLLQQSLGGNAKTIMIANIGPADYNYEETIATLRYASQAKRIKNKPKINEDPKDAMIRQYQQEIQRLKKQLEGLLPMDTVVVEKKVSRQKKDLDHRLHSERERFEKQKNQLIQEDIKKKEELVHRVATVEEQKERQRKKQEELAIKLKEMKEKLLKGNKLKEQARLHDKKLFEAHQQLQERRQNQRRLAEELSQKNQIITDINEKNLTLKEQVEQRCKQLAKINAKLKAAAQQYNDIQEFMTQQREELEEQNRSIVRQLKLVNLIIEQFVPISQMAEIKDRLQFDQGFDDWVMENKRIQPKPNIGSALGFRAPLCSAGRLAVLYGDENPRFRQENILTMPISIVEPTVEEFTVFEISQNVLENLSVVLTQNEDEQRQIAREERPNVYILDPERMNKEEVMRQRENNNRLKTAFKPQTGTRAKRTKAG